MKESRPILSILPIKLVAMTMSFKRSDKEAQILNVPAGENLVKMGAVNPEITG